MSRKSSKPELISVSHLCKLTRSANMETLSVKINMYGANTQTIEFRSENDQRSVLELANEWFPKMGFKPVKLTHNLMNPSASDIVIDADTPLSCNVGSETYWSM